MFIVGEQSQLITELFSKGKATLLVYEIAGIFLFIVMLCLMEILWRMNFRIFPSFATLFFLSHSLLGPLTWFCSQLRIFFEIPMEIKIIILGLIALLDFFWRARKPRFLFYKKMLI
jgi:L-asparagine transporter-like permease